MGRQAELCMPFSTAIMDRAQGQDLQFRDGPRKADGTKPYISLFKCRWRIEVSVSSLLTSAPPFVLWQYSEVDGLLAQMASHNVSPNVVTYNILIDHYARAGFWSRAFGALDQMRASKVSTGTQTHSTGTQTYHRAIERGAHTRIVEGHRHMSMPFGVQPRWWWMVKPHDRSLAVVSSFLCCGVGVAGHADVQPPAGGPGQVGAAGSGRTGVRGHAGRGATAGLLHRHRHARGTAATRSYV